MRQQLPVIIVVVPLIFSIISSMIGQRRQNTAFFMALSALSVCLICAVFILGAVDSYGVTQYLLGGWSPPVGIVYRIDHLNAFMLVLICFIGVITTIHAKKSVEKELPDRVPLFWCLFLLMITGLLGVALTGDLFNLFVFLEVSSLTGYALVAVGNKNATVAGIRYLIIGSIGASFYLLGVGYLYIATGTLNMEDLSRILPELYHSRTVFLGFLFIVMGISIKTAVFPLHIWLPDAYTFAPSAVSAAIAPLVTKVMAYVLIRVMFTVFDPQFSITMFKVTDIMTWIGTIAILYGALMALTQDDFKRMLSYIIVAEIGYIIGGIGLANATALKGALFHIINDAVMMACLFFTAGQIMYQKGGHQIDDFKDIFKSMPITAGVFSVGALAVIGVPPTCGFFSKWYLLLGGIQAHQWGFVAALIICTLINMILFFRIIDKGLFTHGPGKQSRIDPVQTTLGGDAPMLMLIPAIITALAIVFMGIFNQFMLNTVINYKIF